MKVYSYGMTVWSTIHRMRDAYPQEDTYGEIAETHTVPGGEAANAALLLDHWGHDVALDGCHTGELTKTELNAFFEKTGVDITLMTHEDGFPGWRDIVLCAGKSRTVLGWFGRFFSDGTTHWTHPSEEKVRWADTVVLDPFFPEASEELAQLCRQTETDYVTIDCRWETELARNARAIIVSAEFVHQQYPERAMESVMEDYVAACSGLVVITRGSKSALIRAGSEPVVELPTSPIDAVDTLAAGDSFRAGLVHGLLTGLADIEATRLGIHTAAAVCQRFPSIHPLPSIAEIRSLAIS